MGASKPSMFIGSSFEGKRIADTIQMVLEYDVHSTVWHQGVFGLSGGTLESLVAALDDYDFATLVLSADDLTEKRNINGRSPRDNVLFELGLFMGALGRERTFIVHSRTTPPMLPTDLAGITRATFEDRSNLEAALGPACTKIRQAIERHHIRAKQHDSSSKDSEIATLSKMISEQNAMLTSLLGRLTASPRNSVGDPEGTAMDFLEGAWVSSPTGSHAYCRIVEGVPRWVYCFDGDYEATGEYYDFRRMGDEIFGRFRWFESREIRGFAWVRIDNPTQLSGAWWMEEDVPEGAYHNPDLLKNSRGMNSYVWKKRANVKFPQWATVALARLR